MTYCIVPYLSNLTGHISDPGFRNKKPRTMAGFFMCILNALSVTGFTSGDSDQTQQAGTKQPDSGWYRYGANDTFHV